MPKPILLVVPESPRASPREISHLGRALKAQGPLRRWQWGPAGLERAAALAWRAGCRAAIVVDGAAAVECIERVAITLPRLPVALAKFRPGPLDWAPRYFPGPGTPEAAWEFSGADGAAELKRRVARELAALLAPRASSGAALASIVIPCWNGLKYTRQCLESVARWTDGPYEIIVVDNGSSDGTAAYLRGLRDPRLRVISNKRNLGFARAINQGLAAARGRWMVWLNNDVVVTPGWLKGLIACAGRHPRAGAVGPRTNQINGLQRTKAVKYTMKTLPAFAQAWAMQHAAQGRSVHRLTGFLLLHSREALHAVGGLDERFGLGCYEDFDFCLRLVQSGRELLQADDVFVHHHGNKTFKLNRVSNRHVQANRRIFIDKWCHKSLVFLDHLDKELERR